VAGTKFSKKSVEKTLNSLARAGKVNKITSAISPNSKKNKLDSNTAYVFSAQSHHHQLTLFWLSTLTDPKEDGFNWPITKQTDNQGEFAIKNKINFHGEKELLIEMKRKEMFHRLIFVICICRSIAIGNRLLQITNG
jgi:hypothetical protein